MKRGPPKREEDELRGEIANGDQFWKLTVGMMADAGQNLHPILSSAFGISFNEGFPVQVRVAPLLYPTLRR
ncbi:unnamed protein product [Calypogeia fissa]